MSDEPVEEPNEIVAATHEVKVRGEAALRAAGDRVKRWPLTTIGLGVGIGSAAVAAAVLFANRSKNDDKR
jgi:hypothetical protein